MDLQLQNSVSQSSVEGFVTGEKSYQSFILALGDIGKNINTYKIQNGHKDFQLKTSLLIQIIAQSECLQGIFILKKNLIRL